MKCSNIKVCRTGVKEVAISNALQAMWREDFVEKESEKRSLSKEDRLFLSEMKESITFSEGHYVLPLPLRKQTEVPSDGSVKVGPKREKSQVKVQDSDGSQQFPEVRGESKSLSKTEGQTSGEGHTESVKIVSPEVAGCAEEVNEKTTLAGDYVVMPDNRGQALYRLKSTKRRMSIDAQFKEEY